MESTASMCRLPPRIAEVDKDGVGLLGKGLISSPYGIILYTSQNHE